MLNNLFIRPKKVHTLRFGFILAPDRTYPATITPDDRYLITLQKNVSVILEKKDATVENI